MISPQVLAGEHVPASLNYRLYRHFLDIINGMAFAPLPVKPKKGNFAKENLYV